MPTEMHVSNSVPKLALSRTEAAEALEVTAVTIDRLIAIVGEHPPEELARIGEAVSDVSLQQTVRKYPFESVARAIRQLVGDDIKLTDEQLRALLAVEATKLNRVNEWRHWIPFSPASDKARGFCCRWSKTEKPEMADLRSVGFPAGELRGLQTSRTARVLG